MGPQSHHTGLELLELVGSLRGCGENCKTVATLPWAPCSLSLPTWAPPFPSKQPLKDPAVLTPLWSGLGTAALIHKNPFCFLPGLTGCVLLGKERASLLSAGPQVPPPPHPHPPPFWGPRVGPWGRRRRGLSQLRVRSGSRGRAGALSAPEDPAGRSPPGPAEPAPPEGEWAAGPPEGHRGPAWERESGKEEFTDFCLPKRGP